MTKMLFVTSYGMVVFFLSRASGLIAATKCDDALNMVDGGETPIRRQRNVVATEYTL